MVPMVVWIRYTLVVLGIWSPIGGCLGKVWLTGGYISLSTGFEVLKPTCHLQFVLAVSCGPSAAPATTTCHLPPALHYNSLELRPKLILPSASCLGHDVLWQQQKHSKYSVWHHRLSLGMMLYPRGGSQWVKQSDFFTMPEPSSNSWLEELHAVDYTLHLLCPIPKASTVASWLLTSLAKIIPAFLTTINAVLYSNPCRP